LLKHDLRWKRN